MLDKWLDGGSSESLPVISEESIEKKLKGLSEGEWAVRSQY